MMTAGTVNPTLKSQVDETVELLYGFAIDSSPQKNPTSVGSLWFMYSNLHSSKIWPYSTKSHYLSLLPRCLPDQNNVVCGQLQL